MFSLEKKTQGVFGRLVKVLALSLLFKGGDRYLSRVVCCVSFQLVLRDNDIVEVPKDIYKCQKLNTLYLQVNQINVLPPELCKAHIIVIEYINV